MNFCRWLRNGSMGRKVLVRDCQILSGFPVPQIIDRPSCGLYDPDRERSPAARTSDARAQVVTAIPLSPRDTMERQSEIRLERQLWRQQAVVGRLGSQFAYGRHSDNDGGRAEAAVF